VSRVGAGAAGGVGGSYGVSGRYHGLSRPP
jgi:hypothetical protein